MFVQTDLVENVLRQILRVARQHQFAVIAYCFMPDHLHMLVAGRDVHADFARFAKMAKQRTAYEFRRKHGRTLWQPGWFERQLRRSDDICAVVEYILMNPVRAGLAANVVGYPFSGIPPYET